MVSLRDFIGSCSSPILGDNWWPIIKIPTEITGRSASDFQVPGYHWTIQSLEQVLCQFANISLHNQPRRWCSTEVYSSVDKKDSSNSLEHDLRKPPVLVVHRRWQISQEGWSLSWHLYPWILLIVVISEVSWSELETMYILISLGIAILLYSSCSFGHYQQELETPEQLTFTGQGSQQSEKTWLEKYGQQYDQTFSGPLSFSHLPYHRCLENEAERFDIAILGMPFDTAVTYRPGWRSFLTQER